MTDLIAVWTIGENDYEDAYFCVMCDSWENVIKYVKNTLYEGSDDESMFMTTTPHRLNNETEYVKQYWILDENDQLVRDESF